MSVIFYDKDEHPSGFVGFRAVTTLGDEQSYRQKWFSLNIYGFERTKALAYQQNEDWREIANQVVHDRKYDYVNWRTIQDVPGIWCELRIESKKRGRNKDRISRYVYPAFSVCKRISGHKGQRLFRISSKGQDYIMAWENACHFYVLTRQLPHKVLERLLLLMPDPSLFYDELYQSNPVFEQLISRQDLIDKLSY